MRSGLRLPFLLLLIIVIPTSVAVAQDGIFIDVETSIVCSQVIFEVSVSGGSSPYEFTLFFNDGEGITESEVDEFPYVIEHTYPAQGSYEWLLVVTDALGAEETFSGTAVIEGPTVTLDSDPMPPILELKAGKAEVRLIAIASGGEPPYSFTWNAEGWELETDPEPMTSSGTATYSSTGTYEASVIVTDQCGLTESASLPIVVVDEEEDGEACHPTAQKIADAVSSIFPSQAEQTYTCEDIYGIFTGNLTGFQVGFGRMWHAYKLTQEIEELSWEMIRDWHLDGFGWGGLVQLNKIADTLEDIDLLGFVEQVIAGDLSLQDARGAFRAVTKYDAEFEDALARLQSGSSPGELGQFYRLTSTLDIDPSTLDEYLEMGISLSEIRHASKVSEQVGSEWSEILEMHALGSSWGEIGQAHRLANDDVNAYEIHEMGIKEYRDGLREGQRDAREEDRDERTASKLSEQFQYREDEIWFLFNGDCAGDWSCVRAAIREKESNERSPDQDQRTVDQLVGKYGASETEVWGLFNGVCEQSWQCVRTTLREQTKEHGKPEK